MAGPLFNRSSQQPAEPQLQRLHFLVSGLCSRFRLGTLAFVQVWMENSLESSTGTHDERSALLCSPVQPCFVGLPSLQSFRQASCDKGVTTSELGLLGRAFTGSLQLVQNLSIVPKSQHPRNKLKGHEALVSEVVYIPVYDQEKLDEGVFAVIEVMLSSQTSESMAVANLITYASRFMEDVLLSISHEPVQEISSRSSSSTSSSCSTYGSLEPTPRWHVSPRVDASDAHRPSISSESWTQHPTSPPASEALPPCSLDSPPGCIASCKVDPPAQAKGTHQLQPDAPVFVPASSFRSHRLHAGSVGHRTARSSHQAARQSQPAEQLVSPFAAAAPLPASPPHTSPTGMSNLRRSPSIARTTSSRSLSDMSSMASKGVADNPARAYSDDTCPVIPEVCSNPPSPACSPTPQPSHPDSTHPLLAVAAMQAALDRTAICSQARPHSPPTAAAIQLTYEMPDCSTKHSHPPVAAAASHVSGLVPERSAASAENAAEPVRGSWWRIPASKFIPGARSVPPLAVH